MIKYTSLSVMAAMILLGSFSLDLLKSDEDQREKEKVISQLSLEALKILHFNELDLDEEFSKKAFDLYLERLDVNKRFLTEKDVRKLRAYRTQLDDAFYHQNLEFFEFSNELIEDRIEDAEDYYREILKEPFDFTIEESIETDPNKMKYAKNERELKDRWRKYLKFRVLTQVANRLEVQQTASENKDTTLTIFTVEEIEKQKREKIRENHRDMFNRLSKVERSDRFAAYLNSLVNVYDPHTGFFPPKDKENFDIRMSGQLEGIGASLIEKNGFIEVSRIVPGSASWKQGELEAGDVILSVGQGDEEPVDIVDMRLDKAVQLIRGKKGTEVRLTVRKIDGTILVIPIIRDVVILEETYAKSAIIKRDQQPRVGYLQLPAFYADFENKGGRNSGEDIRKEIEKMKEDQVDGLIFDLRNNGGGSLQDVVEIAGIFIDEGPVVQVKARGRSPRILEDEDKGIDFDKPLIILVNKFSASASEILAAAMQDYERAIVLGANGTFGKGTVQQFYDLDRFVNDTLLNKLKPFGSLKLTTQKFYRINGTTTQLQGVLPDKILPDTYNYLELGEIELDHAIEVDEIDPANYEVWNRSYNEAVVLDRLENRIQDDTLMNLIDKNAKRLKRESKETIYSLNLKSYREERLKDKKEASRYDHIDEQVQDFNIMNLTLDQMEIESENDTIARSRFNNWFENVQTDIMINEALSVMYDMIPSGQYGKKEDE